MDKQYFFFDIDDTLYSHKNFKISKENISAIKKAKAAGYKIFLSTGRGLANVFMLNLKLFDGIVCSAGGCIYVNDKVIYRDGYSQEEIASILECIKPYHAEYDLIGEKYTYFSPKGFKYFIVDFFAHTSIVNLNKWKFVLIKKHQKEFYEEVKLGHIAKFTIRSNKGISRDILNKEIIKKQNVMIVDEDKKGLHVLEMTHKNVSKGTGIEKIMQYLNKPMNLVVAVGDSNNDLGITEIDGYSVAMKNGSKELKNRVDYITKRDCEHSGVAEVIYHTVLYRVLKNMQRDDFDNLVDDFVKYALKNNIDLDDANIIKYIKKDH
jgi:Cof subfamily protein (haloacid dehalogenase superfamily)